MDEDVRPEWREAARSLKQSLIEDCTYWISRLQPKKRGLTPEECLHLWSSLGELRFHLWAKTLPIDEANAVNATSKMLEHKLSEAIDRYTLPPPASRSILLVRLEKSMSSVIEEVQHWIDEADRRLRKGQLAESWDQTEFDSYIQSPMDNLGSSIELSRAMKISLSREMIEKLSLLEKNLRSIYPELVRQYRQGGQYPINAGRPVWPTSFWWRY